MKTILLVEDDVNAARATAARLTSDGHRVSIFHSTWDALHAAK
jgi:DNA-binding response OmpR family regulator